MFKNCHVPHFLLLLLLNLGALNAHLGFVVGCHEAEREALFKFKESLVHLNHSLSSWVGMDCCNWDGVGCDNVTAYVNRLDLHNPFIDPSGIAFSTFLVAPKVEPALVELKHLKYLDLSSNDFQGSQIPGFIGSFKQLRYLNLSSSNFSGVVPSQLGNLSRLHNLDLSYNVGMGYTFDYSCDNNPLSIDIQWVSKLVSLKYLSMRCINITKSSMSHMHVLTMLPSLLGLRLSSCSLGNPEIYSIFSNSTWLSRIQQLDLSHNDLEGPMPRVFLNMTSLTYLRLDFNNLNGSIPLWMSMRELEHLDLKYNSFSGIEGGAVMAILGNLCKLKTFDLSGNSIRGSIGANHNYSNCASYALEILRLEGNTGGLGGNTIGGTLPSWLGDFKNLRIINIGGNSIDGLIPLSIRSLLFLEELTLSHNNFTGSLPDCLGDLKALRSLDVSRNNIHGQIPISIGNLSSLVDLDLSDNSLNGHIPTSIGNLSSLVRLVLSYNSLNGHIPSSIGNLSLLEDLAFSQNSLNGTIPESLGRCKSLFYIDLSSNSIQGVLSESLLANLSRLDILVLSFNPLDLNFNPDWSPPFQMSELHMKSCNIESQLPRWIGDHTTLTVLDLSDNMITGKLAYFSSSQLTFIDLSYNMISGPFLRDSSSKNDITGTPICRLPNLGFVDLQANKIIGTIPDCWGNSDNLEYINLSSNNLSGNIPTTIGLLPNLGFLKLTNNSLQGLIPPTLSTCSTLQILDLSQNNLSGSIPINWGKTTHRFLQMINLRGNQLLGTIPPTLCSIPTLQFIDLAHNNLAGDIPRCFGHFIAMGAPSSTGHSGEYVAGPYYSSGGSPIYSDSTEDSTMVVLKGAELQYTTTLKYVVNLDLSCNALVGSIPEEITNLSTLIGLNLSHNHLTGNIPKRIGEMGSLESLDLSNNIISGTIPSSIADLTSLIALNLSYNKLHGQIPTGHQLQVIKDPSMAYIGNPGLYGDPLPSQCKTSNCGSQPHQEQEENGDEDRWEKPLLYFVIMSGLATGFWGVVGSLLLKRRFRFALFQLVDRITDYFYVQVMVRVNRLRN